MQQQQISTGLTRYQSAPSSYFTDFLTVGGTFGSTNDDIETQKILSKFMTGSSETIQQKQNFSSKISLLPKKPVTSSQHLPPRIKKPSQKLHRHRSNDYSPVLFNSTKLERVDSVDLSSRLGGGSSLVRHNSSPAGIFANLDIEKEFGADINLGAQLYSGMMTPISGAGSERTEDGASDRKFGERPDSDNYLQEFSMDSWEDSSNMFDEFIKELVDEKPLLSAKSLENQDNEVGNKPTPRLAHHLSLPTSSAELSAIEKLLHDSVPLKLRAKRGRATHPRSIAERVRRTKISDRMRKLQEVVPHMEKQTNTSDMLDFAAGYIKELQRQERKLSNARAKCSCPAGVKL